MRTTLCMGCFAVLVAASIVTAQQTAQDAQPGRRTDAGQRVRTTAEEARPDQNGAARQQVGAQQEVRRERDAQQRQTQAREQRGQQQQGQMVQQVASKLALANHAEIELAQLALQQSQNEQVRQFAQKMIEDHTEQLNQLRQFIPQMEELTRAEQRADSASRQTRQADQQQADQRTDQAQRRQQRRQQDQRVGEQREGQDQQLDQQARQQRRAQDQDPQRRAAMQHEHSPMLKIAKQASHEKLNMTKALLGKFDGDAFDMGYMGQQVIAHVEMAAHLRAIRDAEVGPQNFQQLINEGLETTEEHLAHAQALANQLREHDGSPRTARQPATQQQQPGTPQPQPRTQP